MRKIPVKVVSNLIFVVILSDSPRCRLGEAMKALPPHRFRLCPPGPGQHIPYPKGRTIAVVSDLLSRPLQSPPELPPACPVIFSGQNPIAAQFAGANGLAPLDCGLSLRDTLTLSSVTDSSAMVSLQRPVAGLDGRILEPVEIPLALTREWAPFPLLCCAGALLLSGGAPALQAGPF